MMTITMKTSRVHGEHLPSAFITSYPSHHSYHTHHIHARTYMYDAKLAPARRCRDRHVSSLGGNQTPRGTSHLSPRSARSESVAASIPEEIDDALDDDDDLSDANELLKDDNSAVSIIIHLLSNDLATTLAIV